MKKLIIALLMSCTLIGQNRIETMLTDHYTKHYVAGVNISQAVGMAYFLWKPHQPVRACLFGFLAGATAGILKESVWDKRMGLGHCNNVSAYETIWGAAVGSLCLRIGIHEFYGKKRTIIYNTLYND